MDLNNSLPTLKAGLRKIVGYLALWALLEIGLFVLVGYLIGFANAFWILLGCVILGYIIRPIDYSLKPKAQLPTARKLASTLLMIPGYLTSIAGILIIIPPIRKLLLKLLPIFQNLMANRIASKLKGQEVPEGLNESFAEQFKKTVTNPSKTKRMSARRAQADGDVIDIDYEIEGGKNEATYDSDYDSRQASKSAPKALAEEEIIDVDVEWENKS